MLSLIHIFNPLLFQGGFQRFFAPIGRILDLFAAFVQDKARFGTAHILERQQMENRAVLPVERPQRFVQLPALFILQNLPF